MCRVKVHLYIPLQTVNRQNLWLGSSISIQILRLAQARVPDWSSGLVVCADSVLQNLLLFPCFSALRLVKFCETQPPEIGSTDDFEQEEEEQTDVYGTNFTLYDE